MKWYNNKGEMKQKDNIIYFIYTSFDYNIICCLQRWRKLIIGSCGLKYSLKRKTPC